MDKHVKCILLGWFLVFPTSIEKVFFFLWLKTKTELPLINRFPYWYALGLGTKRILAILRVLATWLALYKFGLVLDLLKTITWLALLLIIYEYLWTIYEYLWTIYEFFGIFKNYLLNNTLLEIDIKVCFVYSTKNNIWINLNKIFVYIIKKTNKNICIFRYISIV